MAKVLAFAALVALSTVSHGAHHFPKYFFNVPGGFVQSMGDHRGITLGYSFAGSDGNSVAKVYSAIGHTNGITGPLPDRFDAAQVVQNNFFTLKATNGGFIEFIDDGSIDIELLQTIIMDNSITLEIVESQFGRGSKIRVADFIAFLRGRGIIIDAAGSQQQVSTGNVLVLPQQQQQQQIIVQQTRPIPPPGQLPPPPPPPQQDSLPPASQPPPPPPPPPAPVAVAPQSDSVFRITRIRLSGGYLEILIDDESIDMALVERIIIQSGLSLAEIQQAFGGGQIALSQLIAFLESRGFSLVITRPISLGNRRYRLQLVDGAYIVIIDDGYIDLEYLQRVITENKIDTASIRIVWNGREINAQELVKFFTEQLRISIDQRYILVALPAPVLTWTLTLTDGATVAVANDESVDFRAIQVLIAEKRVTLVMFQEAFPGSSGAIEASRFLAWLRGLRVVSEPPAFNLPNGGSGNIFVARFPVTTTTTTVIRGQSQQQQQIKVQEQKPAEKPEGQEPEGSSEEEQPAAPVVTTIRPQVLPQRPQSIWVPAGGLVQTGQVRPIIQTFATQPQQQYQTITVRQPVQRVRVIARPTVRVQEIVEQAVRIPQQQQIMLVQQQPQQLLVTRLESSNGGVAGGVQQDSGEDHSASHHSNQHSSGQQHTVVRTQVTSANLDGDSGEVSGNAIGGGSGVSTVRFTSPDVSYETNEEGLVGSVRTTALQGQTFQLRPATTVRFQEQQIIRGGEERQQQQQEILSNDSGEQRTEFRLQHISGPKLVSTRRFVVPATATEQKTVVLNRGSTQIVTNENSQREEQTVTFGRAERGYLARFSSSGRQQQAADSDEE